MRALTTLVCCLFLTLVSACETSNNTSETSIQNNTVPNRQVAAQKLDDESPQPGNWLTGGGDFQQAYFSPLEQINRKNVAKLGYAWHIDLPSEHGYEATPLMVDGVLYGSGPQGIAFAVDASTGESLWQFNPEINPQFMRKVCCGVVNRGVAIAEETLFVAALDGYLFALDKNDGAVVWRADTFIDRNRGYTITGAPYIANDLVIIGNAGAEFDARGYITAYDIYTGELRWRFFTVPGSPNPPFEHPELEVAATTWDPDSLWEVGLGGTVWDAMAFDPELNLLYVGTGNAAPYPRKLRSPEGGDNLYLASILAINPDNGQLVWHYQTTPGDNWDFTATQKFILATLDIGGRPRQVLMQAPKNGFFYVLDRASGELISAEPYAQVNWASHIDSETGRPVETSQAEYFYEPKLIFPGPQGAHNWQPMSYNPDSGLVYIPVKEAGAIWTMPTESFTYQQGGLNSHSQYIFTTPGEWGLDSALAKTLPPLEVLGAGQPDTTIRGFLRAWNPVTQTLAWERETSGPWIGNMNAFWNGGGVLSTAGGLVFQGRGTGELVALDADTGETLHQIVVGASMMAAPMSYSVGGIQYIALLTGVGGGNGNDYVPGMAAYTYGNAGRMIAFKLNGGEVPKRPEILYADTSKAPPAVPRQGSSGQIAKGEALFLRNCAKCHANIDGRGAGIPDLRRMSGDTHKAFAQIVLEGTLAERGMGNFSDLLNADQVESLHVYLIDEAWRLFDEGVQGGEWHAPEQDLP
ncbi:PQQ-dependent dehydrogenase, methanol/ethanol family [Luminiphilus sp. nBUS_16]|uniref:PQQ-dependent dehydrogenase, methanol/ethanol family n=1 Tax=Luminiphilus sp. nBUS_16 TaxID=3395315 RepID=UPI003EBEAA04